MALLIQKFQELIKPGSFARGHSKHGNIRIRVAQSLAELFDLVAAQLIDAVDDNSIGFLKLLTKNVGRFRRKANVALIVQNLEPMRGLEEYAVGRDFKLSVKQNATAAE